MESIGGPVVPAQPVVAGVPEELTASAQEIVTGATLHLRIDTHTVSKPTCSTSLADEVVSAISQGDDDHCEVERWAFGGVGGNALTLATDTQPLGDICDPEFALSPDRRYPNDIVDSRARPIAKRSVKAPVEEGILVEVPAQRGGRGGSNGYEGK